MSISSNVTSTTEPMNRVISAAGAMNGIRASTGIGTVIASIPVGVRPNGLTVDGLNGQVYVANDGGDNVTVIDGSTNNVARSISVGQSPYDIGLDEASNRLYVSVSDTNNGLSNLTIINGATDTTVGAIPFHYPGSISWDSLNGYLYISTPPTNLTVVDPTTGKNVTSIPVGSTPLGNLVDPLNGEVYVANSYSNNLSAINTTTNKVVGTISAGYSPAAIALDTANGYLYVANDDNGCTIACVYNVTVIDGKSNSVVGWIPTGSAPMSVAYDSANGDIYVANGFGQNVTVINGSTNKVIGSIRVGSAPDGIAYDPGNKDIYVANSATNNVSVIGMGTPSPPVITSFSAVPSTIPLGGLTRLNVTASGGNGTLVYSYFGLPPGCTSTDTANLACKPTATGTYTVRTYANDSAAHSANATATLTVTPALSGTSLNPKSPTVNVNQSVAFNATITCTGGPCPSGITYAWTVNNSLGSVAPSTGPYTNFTAGPSPGPSMLTVTAIQGNFTRQATASITITGNTIPVLGPVTLTPTSATVNTTRSYAFAASASCTPSPCPSGVGYTWSVNNSLGNVSPTTGSSTVFTAGSRPGMITVTVVANWNGVTKWANATVTIPALTTGSLTGVTIRPSVDTLQVGTTVNFTVSPTCSGGSCPSGVAYSWSLLNDLAALNSTKGSTVKLSAGSTAGTVTLLVNATLNGVIKEGETNITISQPPPTNSTTPSIFFGLPGYEGYVLLGTAFAAVVAAVVIVLSRRKKARTVPPSSTRVQDYPEEPEDSPQPPYPPGQ